MTSLVLWTTSRCNLACRYCYAANVPSEDMSFDTFRQAVRMVGDAKIQLTGGEPLLNLTLISKILESPLPNVKYIAIQTNGTLIDNDTAKMLLKHRVAIGVSLDGMPETNERQRGETRNAVLGLECLRRHNLAVNMNVTVTNLNAPKLSEAADMAAYLGNVRGIGLDLIRNAGRAVCGGLSEPSESDLIDGLAGLTARSAALNQLLPRERIYEKGRKLARMPCSNMSICARRLCMAFSVREQVVFPFTAVLGQERIKNALIWNLINPKIGGVLISGEKGTAKSTLVRGVSVLSDKARVVELPLNVTEDRLVGSIDLRVALKHGKVKPEPGILAKADGNILYVDEVNLLSYQIVNALLETAASGVNILEREGISYRYDARFILVGSMNPEEGKLRPQLLDRFGL